MQSESDSDIKRKKKVKERKLKHDNRVRWIVHQGTGKLKGIAKHFCYSCMGVSNCWNGIWNGTVKWNMEWNGGMEYGMERLLYIVTANLCSWCCSSRLS